jgi:hypothetical protein
MIKLDDQDGARYVQYQNHSKGAGCTVFNVYSISGFGNYTEDHPPFVT